MKTITFEFKSKYNIGDRAFTVFNNHPVEIEVYEIHYSTNSEDEKITYTAGLFFPETLRKHKDATIPDRTEILEAGDIYETIEDMIDSYRANLKRQNEEVIEEFKSKIVS